MTVLVPAAMAMSCVELDVLACRKAWTQIGLAKIGKAHLELTWLFKNWLGLAGAEVSGLNSVRLSTTVLNLVWLD